MHADDSVEAVRAAVEAAFDAPKDRIDVVALEPVLRRGLRLLESGECRAAVPREGGWETQLWVKKLILLFFRNACSHVIGGPNGPRSYDKLPLAFDDWSDAQFRAAGIRVVPGAVVRAGSHIARDVVLMPSFVNVGAYVGRGTMIDTWATIGSCAQVGTDCHISGGAGVGGVLEPLNADPVIIEDGVFVGARAEVAEGVRVRRGAVISMGVYLGRSTPIIDRSTGVVNRGEVPENAVVVAGGIASREGHGIFTYAAVIVKAADEETRRKVALNPYVREAIVPAQAEVRR
jgi:2,3,4,5-tetrahydropyridine-2,6-dicarboxylate N-succinyltransferase